MGALYKEKRIILELESGEKPREDLLDVDECSRGLKISLHGRETWEAGSGRCSRVRDNFRKLPDYTLPNTATFSVAGRYGHTGGGSDSCENCTGAGRKYIDCILMANRCQFDRQKGIALKPQQVQIACVRVGV